VVSISEHENEPSSSSGLLNTAYIQSGSTYSVMEGESASLPHSSDSRVATGSSSSGEVKARNDSTHIFSPNFIPLCTGNGESEDFSGWGNEDSSSASILPVNSPVALEAAQELHCQSGSESSCSANADSCCISVADHSKECGVDTSSVECSGDEYDDDSDYDSDFASNKVYAEHRKKRRGVKDSPAEATVTRKKPKLSAAKINRRKFYSWISMKACQRRILKRRKWRRNRKLEKNRNRNCSGGRRTSVTAKFHQGTDKTGDAKRCVFMCVFSFFCCG